VIHLIEKDGYLYVSRPTSWIGGWARHIFLEKSLNRKVSIASPDLWEQLKKTGKHTTVQKDKNGNMVVINGDKTIQRNNLQYYEAL
jgi:hypothetical protein